MYVLYVYFSRIHIYMLAEWGHKTFSPHSNILPTMQGVAGKPVHPSTRTKRLKMHLNSFCSLGVLLYLFLRLIIGGFSCFFGPYISIRWDLYFWVVGFVRFYYFWYFPFLLEGYVACSSYWGELVQLSKKNHRCSINVGWSIYSRVINICAHIFVLFLSKIHLVSLRY